jgi:hypothetical protein
VIAITDVVVLHHKAGANSPCGTCVQTVQFLDSPAVDYALTLPKELWAEAAVAQDERRRHDPWDDILTSVAGHPCVNEETGAEEERVRSDELLKNYLEIPPGKTQNSDALRLNRVMRRLGWSGPKKLRFAEGSKRGYFRKSGEV